MNIRTYCLFLVGVWIMFGMTACRENRERSLIAGAPVPLKALVGKWTQATNALEVAGGRPVRVIDIMEYTADDLHGKMTTYKVGRFGFKHKVGESFFAYTLSDSILTTKCVVAAGTWSIDAITNKLHFKTVTARFKVSIDGDTLTQTRTEVTIEADGKVVKHETKPLASVWRRCSNI